MIKIIDESYVNNKFNITFEYSGENESDLKIFNEFVEMIRNQSASNRCDSCVNYYEGGYFCGYVSNECKIHGCLDGKYNPHYDMDGSKCNDYIQKEMSFGLELLT